MLYIYICSVLFFNLQAHSDFNMASWKICRMKWGHVPKDMSALRKPKWIILFSCLSLLVILTVQFTHDYFFHWCTVSDHRYVWLKWNFSQNLTKAKSTPTPILRLFYLPCLRKDVYTYLFWCRSGHMVMSQRQLQCRGEIVNNGCCMPVWWRHL